jgi:hypothetical protein
MTVRVAVGADGGKAHTVGILGEPRRRGSIPSQPSILTNHPEATP